MSDSSTRFFFPKSKGEKVQKCAIDETSYEGFRSCILKSNVPGPNILQAAKKVGDNIVFGAATIISEAASNIAKATATLASTASASSASATLAENEAKKDSSKVSVPVAVTSKVSTSSSGSIVATPTPASTSTVATPVVIITPASKKDEVADKIAAAKFRVASVADTKAIRYH